MEKIFIVYEYGYEHSQALRAYRNKGHASEAMAACEEYERENDSPQIDDDDDSDSGFAKWELEKAAWKEKHPLKSEKSELGYFIGELDLHQ